MPKRYAGREKAEQVEANLARRIKHLRNARGWSFETLATAMTNAGCTISKAAVYGIEKGDPPRRITVGELAALAEVFELPVDDLLTPLELVEKRRAQELIETLQRNQRNVYVLSADVFAVFLELAPLLDADPDLLDYVRGHYQGNPTGLSTEEFRDWALSIATLVGPQDDDSPWREVGFLRFLEAAYAFHATLFETAALLAAGQAGAFDSDEEKSKMREEIAELNARIDKREDN